jgi:class 3 adenylate cyclase
VSWFRESFGAKLLGALGGTVLLLLLITFMVVRGETARQVDFVTSRAIDSAERLFGELTELQRQQAAQLAQPFTQQRSVVRLSDAIESGDFVLMALEVDYEMQRARLPDALLVFTAADGQPVLSIIGGERLHGDPAGIAPLATELLAGLDLEATAYRLVDGRLYSVTSLYIEDPSRNPVGTITFGLPIASRDVEDIGAIGGFEVCFHVEGRCAVATAGVSDGLDTLMDRAANSGLSLRTSVAGHELFVSPQPLDPTDPIQGVRVIAVPLDNVLLPFERIQRALLFGGVGALLVSALIGVVLSRSLTKPMRALVAATERVAQGDYQAEVSATSHDEMGTLANAFNDMTRGLLLRERYRSVLNKVVSTDVAEELMRGEVELGGESRLVTVLFADIRGFTPLTEGMEPQAVITLLNECMEHLSQAIDAEGGVVDKFIGDEVMAVFGAPVTQDDHARHAVAAAIRMRVGMATFNALREARGDKPLAIGIGINSGVAVSGNMGSTNRMNYTVVGDVVNLASRLTSLARPGQILISGATLRLVGPGLHAHPLGGQALKGFSSEVEVYGVASLNDGSSGAVDRADPTDSTRVSA